MIVEPAHKSDTHATIPLIQATEKLGLKPEEVLADAPYGSAENCGKATTLGVEVLSPVMGKVGEDAVSLAAFTINSENDVTLCPAGCAPEKTRSTDDNHTALFSKKVCSRCLKNKTCPTLPSKKGRYLCYDDKAVRLARRRAREDTPEFRNRYRFRAGIEATMSQLDRLTELKHLRVQGLAKVSFAAFLKAAGINIIRATAFRNRGNDGTGAITNILSSWYCAIKERLQLFVTAVLPLQHLRRLSVRVAAPYAA